MCAHACDARDALLAWDADARLPAVRLEQGNHRPVSHFSDHITQVLGSWGNTIRHAVGNKEWWERRRTPTQDPRANTAKSPFPSASRPVRRALLTRQVSPGSLYRLRKEHSKTKSSLLAVGGILRSLTSAPKNDPRRAQPSRAHVGRSFPWRSGAPQTRSVLGSWVGVWRHYHLCLFPAASRVVLPQDPSTDLHL